MKMIKETFGKSILVLGALLLSGITNAQNTPVIVTGGTSGINATGKQNRIITTSNKPTPLPETKDTTIEIPAIKYYVEPTQHPVDFEVKPITAAKLKIVEPLEKLYPGYIRFGVGNYTMPYVDAYYGSMRSKKNSWGVNVKHHSATGRINDVGNSSFSENHVNGFYKHFLRNHVWQTNLNYDRDVAHYYGFLLADSLIPQEYRDEKDSSRIAYNLVGFQSNLYSKYRDSSKLHHEVGLSYYYLNNSASLQEHNVVANTTLSKYLEEEHIEANVDFEIDFNSLNQPSLNPIDTISTVIPSESTGITNTGIIRLVPYVVNNKILNKLHFKGGFGINIDIGPENKFYFYPELELSYNLFNNVFIPYAGATGGVKRNSWNNLRNDNPFLLSNSAVLNTNERINVYGGIRGSISSEWSFNLTGRFQNLSTQPLFINDTAFSYGNAFQIVYDSIKKTTISGQLSYQKDEKFMMYAKAEYFINKSQNQEFAWLMPDFNVSLNATYDLADKIIARANVFVIGNRKTFSFDSIPGIAENANDDFQYSYDLKPYVDANLGLEYRYNKRLSAFVNFNNLVASKYQRFTNFPVQRFQVLGGFTFRF